MGRVIRAMGDAHLPTVVGVSLSLISFYFFLPVLLLSKKFHNLPGRNLLSFCIARMIVLTLYSYCNAVRGCDENGFMIKLIEYFNVCPYAWNLVIAYDTWRTLRISLAKCRIVAGNRWRRFLAYSVFGWGFPLVSSVLQTRSWLSMDPRSVAFHDLSTIFANFSIYPLLIFIVCSIYFSSASLYYIWRNGNSIRTVNPPTGIDFFANFGLPLRLFISSGYFSLLGILFWTLQWVNMTLFTSIVHSYQGVFITFLFIYRRNVFESIEIPGSRKR